jgi:hypothetical protein
MYHRTLLIAVVSLLIASPALADGGWSMPNLNPFAQKAGPPTSARVSDRDGSWKMPKMWPSSGKTIVKKQAAPSTWQKMKGGTKSFFTKTADALNPFDDNDKPQPIQVTGSNSFVSQVANGKSSEKKSGSFVPSWWSGDEKPKKAETVQDFLNQPRPGF